MADYVEIIRLELQTGDAKAELEKLIGDVEAFEQKIANFSAGRISQSFAGVATSANNALDRIAIRLKELIDTSIAGTVTAVQGLATTMEGLGPAAETGAAQAADAISGIATAGMAANEQVGLLLQNLTQLRGMGGAMPPITPTAPSGGPPPTISGPPVGEAGIFQTRGGTYQRSYGASGMSPSYSSLEDLWRGEFKFGATGVPQGPLSRSYVTPMWGAVGGSIPQGAFSADELAGMWAVAAQVPTVLQNRMLGGYSTVRDEGGYYIPASERYGTHPAIQIGSLSGPNAPAIMAHEQGHALDYLLQDALSGKYGDLPPSVQGAIESVYGGIERLTGRTGVMSQGLPETFRGFGMAGQFGKWEAFADLYGRTLGTKLYPVGQSAEHWRLREQLLRRAEQTPEYAGISGGFAEIQQWLHGLGPGGMGLAERWLAENIGGMSFDEESMFPAPKRSSRWGGRDWSPFQVVPDTEWVAGQLTEKELSDMLSVAQRTPVGLQNWSRYYLENTDRGRYRRIPRGGGRTVRGEVSVGVQGRIGGRTIGDTLAHEYGHSLQHFLEETPLPREVEQAFQAIVRRTKEYTTGFDPLLGEYGAKLSFLDPEAYTTETIPNEVFADLWGELQYGRGGHLSRSLTNVGEQFWLSDEFGELQDLFGVVQDWLGGTAPTSGAGSTGRATRWIGSVLGRVRREKEEIAASTPLDMAAMQALIPIIGKRTAGLLGIQDTAMEQHIGGNVYQYLREGGAAGKRGRGFGNLLSAYSSAYMGTAGYEDIPGILEQLEQEFIEMVPPADRMRWEAGLLSPPSQPQQQPPGRMTTSGGQIWQQGQGWRFRMPGAGGFSPIYQTPDEAMQMYDYLYGAAGQGQQPPPPPSGPPPGSTWYQPPGAQMPPQPASQWPAGASPFFPYWLNMPQGQWPQAGAPGITVPPWQWSVRQVRPSQEQWDAAWQVAQQEWQQIQQQFPGFDMPQRAAIMGFGGGQQTGGPWQMYQGTQFEFSRAGQIAGEQAESGMGRFGQSILRTAGYFLRWLIVWNLFEAITGAIGSLVREMMQLEEVSARVSFIMEEAPGKAGGMVTAWQQQAAAMGVSPQQIRPAIPGIAAYGLDAGQVAQMMRAFGVAPEAAATGLQSAMYYTGLGGGQIADLMATMYRAAPTQQAELLQIVSEAGMLSQMTGIDVNRMAMAMAGVGREMGVSPIQAATAMQRISTRVPDWMMPGFIQEMQGLDRGDMARRLLELGIATERGGRQVQTMVELIKQLGEESGDTSDNMADMMEAIESTPAYQWDVATAAMGNLWSTLVEVSHAGENAVIILSKIAEVLGFYEKVAREATSITVSEAREGVTRIIQDPGIIKELLTTGGMPLLFGELFGVGRGKRPGEVGGELGEITTGTEGEARPRAYGLSMAGIPGMIEYGAAPVTGFLRTPRYDISERQFRESVLPRMLREMSNQMLQEEQLLRRTLLEGGATGADVEDQIRGLREGRELEFAGMGGPVAFAGGRRSLLSGREWAAAQMAEQQGLMSINFQWQRDISQGAFQRAWDRAGREVGAIEAEYGIKFDTEEFILAFKEGTDKYVGSNEQLTRTMQLLNNTLTGTWNIPSGVTPMIPYPVNYSLLGPATPEELGVNSMAAAGAALGSLPQVLVEATLVVDGSPIAAAVESIRTTWLNLVGRTVPQSAGGGPKKR